MAQTILAGLSDMIPTAKESTHPLTGIGSMLFHVVVDDFGRAFTIDGPETNGVRLHFEMLQSSRALNKKLRDFDLRVASLEAALSEMRKYFPGYRFLGSWKSSKWHRA